MTNPIRWHDPRNAPFKLLGFPWFDTYRVYRRLPPKTGALPIPDAVNDLANHTAGGQIRFRTNSSHISVRVTLSGPANMCHMPATGQCGFDCYVHIGGWRFTGCAKYEVVDLTYESALFAHDAPEWREVILNFPLYQGVQTVEVGLDADASVDPPSSITYAKRCVIYGTSITQGGCASRPGLAHTNILSRRLGAECVNLGFSGSGRGEPVMAEIMADIADSGCFVLDYEANAGYDILVDTMPNFIEILRKKHPATPILVVSKTPYAALGYSDSYVREQQKNRALQRGIVDKCRASGDADIHFMDGSLFFGDGFDEYTVDGAHPNDIGFMKIADSLAPVLQDLMGI